MIDAASKERVALVTGSPRGIGRATIGRLARDHGRLVVHYRRQEEQAQAVAEALRAEGADVRVIRAELEKGEEIEQSWGGSQSAWCAHN